jgi:hypothetical protein
MSYEVYIDVRHHPRHLEDWEQRLSTADRWTKPEDTEPSSAERMRAVCNSLRAMADDRDPDFVCSNCGKARHEHHGYPDRLVKCFNRYGPVAQHDWWPTGSEAGQQ